MTENTIKILYAVFTISISYPSYSMQFNPKELKIIAGKALAKDTKSIKNLPMPEECQAYLGLIKIQELITELNFRESVGLRLIDDSEYLDIAATEYFTKKSFEQLIQEKSKNGLPFILAIVTTKEDGIYKHSCYDALQLNEHFLKKYNTLNRYTDNSQNFIDPLTSNSIIGGILYFRIDSALDAQADFICTDYDVQVESKLTKFLKYFFEANSGDDIAQFNLAITYSQKGDLEQAKHYYKLAACQVHSIANFNLGCIYDEEGNIKEAKRYYNLAADQGHLHAIFNLANIYAKKGNVEQAKHYYFLASCQNFCDAQFNLALIYIKEGNIGQAKHYFTLAANQNDPEAQNNLGRLYENEGNIDKAKEYYSLAAAQGHSMAKINLIRMHKK